MVVSNIAAPYAYMVWAEGGGGVERAQYASCLVSVNCQNDCLQKETLARDE